MLDFVTPAAVPAPVGREAWPPNYVEVFRWRQQNLMALREDPKLLFGAKAYYAQNYADFICHWMMTYDPRNAGRGSHKPAYMPFILFPKQAEMVSFLDALILAETDGLIEKARDMGATWLCAAYSVCLWLFKPGAAVGWGSRKEQLVDKLADPDSIFEKIRILIKNLPAEFLPEGFTPQLHMSYMKILNPETGATITGEAGDNIGRGGRKLIYFKDESAHYERPELIEAALGDNTRVQVDISSVNGIGNVFHRRREAGIEWDGGEAEPNRTNVFIMDWRDHPEKTQEWYDRRRQKSEDEGLLHVFSQEVDRDYAASVEGVIIPTDWVQSAIDAHVKLGLPEPSGTVIGGFDVADEGGDLNAFGQRKGYMLLSMDEWGSGDVGKSTRRVVTSLHSPSCEIQYDCIGVGAGVKAEANRLAEEKLMPKGAKFIPWSAGAGVQHPDKHYVPRDKQTPLNKDFYANLKAQGWWQLRLRFERTHKAITEGLQYNPDDLISLPSTLPKLSKLRKELSQATASKTTGSLKLKVDKTPEGSFSPNMADAMVMMYWPIASSYDLSKMVRM